MRSRARWCAKSGGRIDANEMAECLASYKNDTVDRGPIGVVFLTHDSFRKAQQFVLQLSIRSLDALPLATAQIFTDVNDDYAVALTLDHRQVDGARTLGLTLYNGPPT